MGRSQKLSEDEKIAALHQLLNGPSNAPVHLISTPYEVVEGFNKAYDLKADHHKPPEQFCYNPNSDCPQEGGGGWMAQWFKVCDHASSRAAAPHTVPARSKIDWWVRAPCVLQVCDRTLETHGTVFVVYNSARTGQYGEGDYAGKFDGQAQQGEVNYAKKNGCKLEWVEYSPANAGIDGAAAAPQSGNPDADEQAEEGEHVESIDRHSTMAKDRKKASAGRMSIVTRL